MASERQTAQPESEVASEKRKLSAREEDAPKGDENTLTKSTNGIQPVVNRAAQPTTHLAPMPINSRFQAISTKQAQLASTLSDLQSQKYHLVSECILPSGLALPSAWTDEEKATSALATANTVIKDHISLLQKYNEIKDIAQGLMGLIAESRGVQVKVVMEEHGMGEGD